MSVAYSKLIPAVLTSGLVLVWSAIGALAERRHAIVFGNDRYDHVVALERAVNDASVIASTLSEIGFEVTAVENATRRGFNRALQDFNNTLEPGDIAFFFFAGHGIAIEGRNYLLPSDIPEARPGQEQFIRSEAIAVDEVMAGIGATGARISILVIDACRDNPFAREGTRSLGSTRGLARSAPPAGSFVLYSAGVGQTALDRLGESDRDPNSVFTRKLASLLREPGLALTETARRVRRDVQALAATVSHEQRPAYYDEVSGDFFLAGAPERREASTTPLAPHGSGPSGAAEAWAATKDTTSIAVLKAFMASFPRTVYATMAGARITELEQAEAEAKAEPRPQAGAGGASATPNEQTHASLPSAGEPRDGGSVRQLHYLTGLDPAGDNWLALRGAPSTSGTLIARMGPETLLDVTGRSGSWLAVTVETGVHQGRTGWAHANYIACCTTSGGAGAPAAVPPASDPGRLHYVTGLDPAGDNWLALRSGPGTGARRLAKMGPDTLLRVIGQSGPWLEVVVQNTALAGYRGFAHSRYIACCRGVAVRMR